MKEEEFERFLLVKFFERLKMFKKKRHDYATDDDCLSNFKRLAELIKILRIDTTKPEGVALFFTVHKLDRVCNLLCLLKNPENESLQDNLNDLQNYLDLLRGILIEKFKR